MSSRKPLFLILALIGILSSACDDVIEKDIEDDTVTLVAPANNMVSNISYQQFWWEELEGSNTYQLQIVSPSFDSIAMLLVDSILEKTQFEYTLLEGQYEWRVIGINDAYESQFQVFRLEIRNDSSANLSNKLITQLLPASGSCTSQSEVTLSWSEVAQAESYQLQISEESDFSQLLIQESLDNNTFTYTLSEERSYYWRVRAENQQTLTVTPWATSSITLDQTGPGVPVLLFPAEAADLIIADQSPDLSWLSADDSLADTLYIYADEAANGLVLKTATENSGFDLENSPIDFNQFVGEDFFWEVISTDKAGNQSEPGELRLFYIEM